MPAPLQFEYKTGPQVETAHYRLIPFSRSLTLRNQQGNAWFVWNKPSAVLVEHPDGHEEILPVRDLTWQIIGSLLGVSLAGLLLFWVISQIDRKNTRR